MRYSEAIHEHFDNPRNIGVIEFPDGAAEVSNPACGDIMHLTLRIVDARITEAKFKTMGCPAAIAAGSVTTELLVGRSIDEPTTLTRVEVNEALGGLSPQKVHTSVLAEDAVKAAVGDYRRRQAT
jgi:nitrogen fixation NifU-like protein